jgi:hypothetical protein
VTHDPVVDLSDAQKAERVEKLRADLAELGYAIIRMRPVRHSTDHHKEKRR